MIIYLTNCPLFSELGCGKTTQVPQYILEHHQFVKQPCSIVVAEPRRIAAVTMANRISFERGEQTGQTVGFQIRLESKLSPKTLLLFCTNGVLVRTLISSKFVLDNISHIIIDEVHERDYQTDLLMLFFKEMKHEFPNIKFIFMSASLDAKKLSAYLFNCPIIEVPGQVYDVQQFFLEDILEMTNFSTHNMSYFKNFLLASNKEQRIVDQTAANLKKQIDDNQELSPDSNNNDNMNNLIVNSLMIQSTKSTTYEGDEQIELNKDRADLCNSCDPNSLLDLYLMAYDQSFVDIKLIYEVIVYIFKTWPVYENKSNTILIFLPGYNEIIDLRDYIAARTSGLRDTESFIVYTIHSQINTTDQKKMFECPPPNVRKIILSTNISETSITIDDVGYVIDSGKVKETLYDSSNDFSMLYTFWTSKSSVLQRKGRAGRCQNGFCFHLYTRSRFENMEEFQSPIIQRMPMYEICLQSKLLLQDNRDYKVEDFLQRALDPPNILNINTSIDKLKIMGALNLDNSLSELGVHLLDLPLEPCLGKMVLFAVLLRCLDPVLTITCTLAHKDPFGIVDRSERDKQLKSKIDLSKDSFSDHMILLRVFQEWQKAQVIFLVSIS